MIKQILLSAVIIFFISCSSNKNLTNYQMFPSGEYFNSPNNYLHDSSYIPDSIAIPMIELFPRHKFRGLSHKMLTDMNVSFDLHLLQSVTNNPDVTSIKYFPAANTKKGKYYRYPTVLMQVIVNVPDSNVDKSKGSTTEELRPPALVTQYYSPVYMCPPPTNDCKIQ